MFNDAKWITSKESTTNILIFRKSFSLTKKLTKATLNICGLGFYNVLVNGIKFKQDYFKPVVSDYKHRNTFYSVDKNDVYFAYFDTYDITNLIFEKIKLQIL